MGLIGGGSDEEKDRGEGGGVGGREGGRSWDHLLLTY